MHSGKFVIRMPPTLHQKLAKWAMQEGVSLNKVCTQLLESGLRHTHEEPAWQRAAMELLPLLQERFGGKLLGVALFGSQVSGEATARSDLDILIVLDRSIPIHRSLYRWWEEAVPYKREPERAPHFVHLPVKPRTAGSLWFEITLKHKILYQKKRCLDRIFRELQQLIDSAQIRRESVHGHPYWVWTDERAA